MEIIYGLILVTLAGLGTGTSAWPIKKIKELHFEQYLFVFMFTGIIVYPWVVVFFNVADILTVIRKVGWEPLIISNLLSVSWGVANILFLICVVRIGAALSGAILSAVGISVGVLIPMIFKGSGLFRNSPGIFSTQGYIILYGLVVILIGVFFVSMAGFGREKKLRKQSEQVKADQASGRFINGLLLVVLAGILSCGISLAFVYVQGPVIEAVMKQGAGDITANFTVWALGMFGGGLVNIAYALSLMAKNNSWSKMFARKDEIVYGSVIGLQFIVSIILLGKGMILLGVIGASIGFAIQQSMQIVGNQIVGFVGNEWKGVTGQPRKTMYLGITIILIAVVILAYSNSI